MNPTPLTPSQNTHSRPTAWVWLSLVVLLAFGFSHPSLAGAAPESASLSLSQNQTLAGFSLTPVWSQSGESNGDEFGSAVSITGDVNGDGRADLLVGAAKMTDQVYREGRAFLYLSGPSGPGNAASWQTAGEQQGSRYGSSLAIVQDVNGDGRDDILIGAPSTTNPEAEEGAAYLFYGQPGTPALTPDWRVESNTKSAQFGYAVASAGDVNKDGFGDVMIGAPNFTSPLSGLKAGAVFGYYGSASGLPFEPDWVVYGGQAGADFGMVVAGVGDLNKDGYTDVAIAAPYYVTQTVQVGAVYVYLGGENGLAETPAQVVYGQEDRAQFGYALAGAGDVNQDGYADLIIGEPYHSSQLVNQGAAYFYLGSGDGLFPIPVWSYIFPQGGSQFGCSVGSAGDVNQDGFPDVFVGASMFDGDKPDQGAIYAFAGYPGGLGVSVLWRGLGNKADASFGFTFSGGTDLDLDNHADLVVGAPVYRVNFDLVGSAFLYLGTEVPVNFKVFIPLLVTQ